MGMCAEMDQLTRLLIEYEAAKIRGSGYRDFV